MNGPLSNTFPAGCRARLCGRSRAEASWQTRQSRRKGRWPSFTCSSHERDFTFTFAWPSTSFRRHLASSLIMPGAHLANAFDELSFSSSVISHLGFSTARSCRRASPRCSPQTPFSGPWKSIVVPTVVGFTARPPQSPCLKVTSFRLWSFSRVFHSGVLHHEAHLGSPSGSAGCSRKNCTPPPSFSFAFAVMFARR